jgi:cytochrome c oxidase assembly factor CtaG
MTWWCAATDAPWSWAWRAYPGVWLVMALLATGYYLWRRRTLASGRGEWPSRRIGFFAIGWLLMWAALDWPIGALGGGYLASMHTLQWLLLAQIAPPFLLLGVPAAGWPADQSSGRGATLRAFAGPLPGLLIFNSVLLITHVPALTDALMSSQAGSFLIDTLWFLSGLALWWPIVAPAPYGRLREPAKMGYLFAATILPTAPAAFLTFAEYPVYRLYELAPRVSDISARSDQQLAGLLMKAIADPIMWVTMGVLFFRWSAREHAEDAAAAVAHHPRSH